MSEGSKIEWLARPGTKAATWNPLVAYEAETGKRGWWCAHVSPGCENCYAEAMNRWVGNGVRYRAQDQSKVTIELDPKTLAQPLRWREPHTVFPCSMTDLFAEHHTDEQIAAVFGAMAATPQHTYLVLTKRAKRMREWCLGMARAHAADLGSRFIMSVALNAARADYPRAIQVPAVWPLPNVWLGISAEDQQRLDERVPDLIATPAAVRWLSLEPLLGPLDLRLTQRADVVSRIRPGSAPGYVRDFVDWAVVGGESGPGARPCDVDDVGGIVRQCRAASVPVFVKQLGSRPRWRSDVQFSHQPQWMRLHDRKGGDPTEWPEDLRVREFPA